MKITFARFILLLSFISAAMPDIWAQTKPLLPEIDRVRLREAFRISQAIGGRVWQNWDRAPFAVLLVTPEYEFLIGHPEPSADFTAIGYDKFLKARVYYRPRIFSPNLLATFPAVKGSAVPVVVIGQAENTSRKTSSDWVLTMLHEHFHQFQSSQPDYYQKVGELNLAGGDQTGMWMLNYPFPYANAEVKSEFEKLGRLLAQALRAKTGRKTSAKAAEYFAARSRFQMMLKPDDAKYISFQLWQEGVARYTEYRAAEAAAKYYQPSRRFRALKDYLPFRAAAGRVLKNIFDELNTLELEKYQRVAFYPLGAGEALLLDKVNSKWKKRYLTNLSIEADPGETGQN